MIVPSFKGDALPIKRARKKTNTDRFRSLSKSEFEHYCLANSIEEGSLQWMKLFNDWRKAVAS